MECRVLSVLLLLVNLGPLCASSVEGNQLRSKLDQAQRQLRAIQSLDPITKQRIRDHVEATRACRSTRHGECLETAQRFPSLGETSEHLAPTAAPTSPPGYPDPAFQLPDTTCHSTCKTCIGSHEKYCTSCNGEESFVAFNKYKTFGGKRVFFGQCLDAATSKMDETGAGCVFSGCTDSRTGNPVEVKGRDEKGQDIRSPAKDIICTRICMFGADYTKIKNLQCNNTASQCVSTSTHNPEIVPAEFRTSWLRDRAVARSSPICLFHKVVKCSRDNYDEKRCRKGEGQFCEQCKATKEIQCHAIVASRPSSVPQSGFTQAQKDMCAHAIDPCAAIGRYL